VDHCIYDSAHDDGDLSKEHVVPEGLGGKVELLRASCAGCRDKTSTIERLCLREMLQPIRQLLELGRLRNRRPLMVQRTSGVESANGEWREARPGEYPLHLALPIFARPGLLDHRSPMPAFFWRDEQTFFHVHSAGEYKPGDRITLKNRFHQVYFGQMLAKIGHSAGVALLGHQAFEPLLPQIIIGGYPFPSHLIGSPAGPAKTILDVRDITDGPLHQVNIFREQNYVVAHVRLFAQYGFLGYEVVIGRAHD
jgi:hypothetical protein